jgi:Zinc finger, C3HC4 type (RING finger)
MVKIDSSKEMFNKMDPRKLEKIQIFPSKQHCGYSKMSNQLPKLTKTIMSPLTTMPPKKLMVAPPHNGVAVKPSPASPQGGQIKQEPMTSMQMSAMKNNFAAKHTYGTMPCPPRAPTVVAQPKSEPKIIEKVSSEAAAATATLPLSSAAGYRSEKISLDAVHPYITCFLCRGYLIKATTIVECLHTYCHSCLMRHLAKEKCCPQCDMSINKSKTNIK